MKGLTGCASCPSTWSMTRSTSSSGFGLWLSSSFHSLTSYSGDDDDDYDVGNDDDVDDDDYVDDDD